MASILVVDDEPSLVDLLVSNLELAGYDVHTAVEGIQAQALALQMLPDLIVLDRILPNADGLTLCQRLRRDRRTCRIPILMVTALGNPEEIVAGFNAGVDDYLTKAFQLQEFLARVRALLLRTHKLPNASKHDEILTYGPLTLIPERWEAIWFGAPVQLTRCEFEILSCLMQRHGQIVSLGTIIQEVGGYEPHDGIASARVHIPHLRGKLERDFKHPQYIKTFYGEGYCLELPPSNQP